MKRREKPVSERRHVDTSRNRVARNHKITVFRDASLQRLFATTFAVTSFVACSHAPPADFAPDPGLISQVRDLRIVTTQDRACPGGWIQTSYEAVLADGSRVPFARTYDKKHPPRLHVVFLERSSPDAVSRESGDWVTNANPLWTAASGFRLTATLSAKPAGQQTVVIPPEDGWMSHGFPFSGGPGGAGRPAPYHRPAKHPFPRGVARGAPPGGRGGAGGRGGKGGKGGKGGRGTRRQGQPPLCRCRRRLRRPERNRGAQRLGGCARSPAPDRDAPDLRAVRPECPARARSADRAGGRATAPPVTGHAGEIGRAHV